MNPQSLDLTPDPARAVAIRLDKDHRYRHGYRWHVVAKLLLEIMYLRAEVNRASTENARLWRVLHALHGRAEEN